MFIGVLQYLVADLSGGVVNALMRSDLSPQGARYRELASAELTPGPSGPSACGGSARPREADMTDDIEAQ